ncbi:Uncharacterized conserved protein BCN92 [Phaffia rhodozyma]|uniref:Uncharacterized conserved protein BCN92 n=1 Tax=Phaffia rhodozyma TaxID=264483 RepID=A0A0F7SQQ7_PHARH|nr:Uncharacterized conserved protein BCN92 [Phaffia rhodozyma]
MSAAPTQAQLQTLYRSSLQASRQFASYNFRSYFVRRTKDQFKAIPSTTQPDILKAWFADRTNELETMKRSAVVNRMFEGPKLVVERDLKEVEEGVDENDTLLEHMPAPGEPSYTC